MKQRPKHLDTRLRRRFTTAYTIDWSSPLPTRPKLNEENLAAASDEPLGHGPGPLPRPETAELPQAIRALRNPNFRLFWAGNFTSNIGTWMQNVAQGWLVLTLTNSAFWLGVVGFAGSIPFLFVTLFGGVIADRVNKRRLLHGDANHHDVAGVSARGA